MREQTLDQARKIVFFGGSSVAERIDLQLAKVEQLGRRADLPRKLPRGLGCETVRPRRTEKDQDGRVYAASPSNCSRASLA
jgi:hypothetical protein